MVTVDVAVLLAEELADKVIVEEAVVVRVTEAVVERVRVGELEMLELADLDAVDDKVVDKLRLGDDDTVDDTLNDPVELCVDEAESDAEVDADVEADVEAVVVAELLGLVLALLVAEVLLLSEADVVPEIDIDDVCVVDGDVISQLKLPADSWLMTKFIVLVATSHEFKSARVRNGCGFAPLGNATD